MRHVRGRHVAARCVSALLATIAVFGWSPVAGAPADIFISPAPTMGSDPPKATDLKDGDSSVSSQTGALAYSYPISVPPGRNGMAPTLALAYSSQGSIYGGIASGWTLAIPGIYEDHSVGRLATRAPEVEVTQPGIDAKVDDRFISMLAGGLKLVPVTEFSTMPTGVYQTYRVDGDSSYTRYERMLGTADFRWRAWTSDGKTLEFGAPGNGVSCQFSDQFAPLTRVADAFGNSVTYTWTGSWAGAGWECRISKIEWGQNPAAGIAEPFARVDFSYAGSPASCGQNPAIPVGSQSDFRSGYPRVYGASKLTSITATAFAPGSSTVDHTRVVTLNYIDGTGPENYPENSEACSSDRSPLRQLRSIQESAWGPNAARVDLPPVQFYYRPRSQLSSDVATGNAPWTTPPWIGGPYPRQNLAWGYRRNDDRWPSIEEMLIDIDGDGLPDRVANAATPTAASISNCSAYWQRNQGNGTFGGVWRTIPLPRLKWRGEAEAPVGGVTAARGAPYHEGCALNGQVTAYRNSKYDNTGTCHNGEACYTGNEAPGQFCEGGTPCPPTVVGGGADNFRTYLAYRWLDMDSDGLPDLVAAVHGNTNVYDIEFGNRIDGTGNYQGGEPSMSGIPAAGQWPACPGEQDRCSELSSCISQAYDCPGNFCSLDWAALNACNSTAVARTCFEYLARPAPDTGTPQALQVRRPYERCEGLYPWLIYRNKGDGEFDQTPVVKYQPIPLESDTGDSALNGPSLVSQHHAVMDFDGDGILDAVAHGKPGQSSGAAGYWVWLGDGSGGFGPKRYVFPTRYEGDSSYGDLAGNANALSGTGTDPATSRIATRLGLFDVNGDGLPDHWLAPIGSQTTTNVAMHDGVQQRLFGPTVSTLRGELSLPSGLIPGSDAAYVYTDGGPGTGNPVRIGSSSLKGRLVDADSDGRLDYVSLLPGPNNMPEMWWNVGGQYERTPVLPYSTGPQEAGFARQTSSLNTGDSIDPLTWELKSDLVDLDGNGFAESVYFDGSGYHRLVEAAQPQRLLWKIDNGRGVTTTVDYAHMHDSSVVAQDPDSFWTDPACLAHNPGRGCPKASPRSQWVVKNVATTDAYSPASTTSYRYINPRVGPGLDGHFAFRGFQEVVTTSPSGMRLVERFGYDVDPTGRLLETIQQPSVAEATPGGDGVHSIQSTEWDVYTLFGTVRSYQARAEESWTCGVGQIEFACRGTPAGYTRSFRTYNAMSGSPGGPNLLWVENTSTISLDDDTLVNGDRKTESSHSLLANSGAYRLRPRIASNYHYLNGNWLLYAKSEETWAHEDRVPDETKIWVDADEEHALVSHAEYDPQTGNVLRTWKPKQWAAGSDYSDMVYDARKLFVASVTNEMGHVTENEYDYGTGVLVLQRGPNERTCQSCGVSGTSPIKQTQRTVADGLGRTVEKWATVADDLYSFTLEKLETNTYSDPLGGPSTVLNRSLVDQTGPLWKEVLAESDGYGRPRRTTTYVQGSASANHVTTYAYDAAGQVVSLTTPNPASSTSGTATYEYTYDSLGRAKTLRRPDASAASARSGTNVEYNGLSRTIREVVGSAGGQEGETITITDVFGRVVTVQEKTASSAYATTTYVYGPNDLVETIVDPSNSIVEFDYDLANRRTKVIRSGQREWGLVYDANGNVESETVPFAGDQTEASKLAHTTFFFYDNLDRITWKYIAPRDLDSADLQHFGIHREQFVWDTVFKGKQRSWHLYPPTGAEIFRVDSSHDAAGRFSGEYQTGDVLGLSGANPSRSYTIAMSLSGLPVEVQNLVNGVKLTATSIQYDARGLPHLVRLTYPTASAQDLAAYTRNASGLVTTRTSPTGTSSSVESVWSYDSLGRVSGQRIRQLPGPIPVATQQLSYFGNDDISTLEHSIGTTVRSFSYSYDPRHQLKQATAAPASYFQSTYDYDDAGRLTHAAVDQSPLLTASEIRPRDINYVYGGADPDQVTGLANVSPLGTNHATYTYDARGNQLTRTYPASNETWEYLYDGKDQLRRVKKKLNGLLQGSEEYWYDSSGKRTFVIKRDEFGIKTEMIWFMGQVEAHYDGNGDTKDVYTHAEMGTPVARILTSPVRVEYQFHGISNNTIATVAVSRHAGAVASRFVYAPFGEVLEVTDNGGKVWGIDTLHRRFNDKFQDSIGGLTYYGARYYDKTLIGWTQSDPLYLRAPDAAETNPRRANGATFSLNNPLRYMDPDGLDSMNWGANNFFGHAPKGSLAATGNIIEGGGWGPTVGGGETVTTARRRWRQENLASGGALGLALWKADKGYWERVRTSGLISRGYMLSPRGDLSRRGRTPGRLDRAYELDDRMRNILFPFFSRFANFNVGDVRLRFGFTNGQDAFTIGNWVTLDEDRWNAMSSYERLILLAHEITHCVQYKYYGGSLFMIKYATEYFTKDNYIPPLDLVRMSIDDVHPADPRYTFDQIAERVAQEFKNTTNPKMPNY